MICAGLFVIQQELFQIQENLDSIAIDFNLSRVLDYLK